MNVQVAYSSANCGELVEMSTFGRWRNSKCRSHSKLFTNQQSRIVLIRVYQGGIDSHQIGPFQAALSDHFDTLESLVAPREIIVEYMTVKAACAMGWTMPDIFDWLVASTLHFVLSHPHQGFASHGRAIEMNGMMRQMLRLASHPGFPQQRQLQCPVLTQDKFRYIALLDPHCIPTMKIFVPQNYAGEPLCPHFLLQCQR